MFRQRSRPAPFADFINWTDYRWEPGPFRRPSRRGLHARPGRRYSFLQVFLAGLAVVAGLKLMSALRNSGNRSWLERAVFGVLLLAAASYVSGQRHRF